LPSIDFKNIYIYVMVILSFLQQFFYSLDFTD